VFTKAELISSERLLLTRQLADEIGVNILIIAKAYHKLKQQTKTMIKPLAKQKPPQNFVMNSNNSKKSRART